jgi:hypothetical protein
MNIEANNEGWRFDESIGWKLIHNDIDVIFFGETEKAISTQEKLFVGTKEECENIITELHLNYYTGEELVDSQEEIQQQNLS